MNARLEDFVKDTNELNQTIQLEVEYTDIFQSMSVLGNQAADAMQKALQNG